RGRRGRAARVCSDRGSSGHRRRSRANSGALPQWSSTRHRLSAEAPMAPRRTATPEAMAPCIPRARLRPRASRRASSTGRIPSDGPRAKAPRAVCPAFEWTPESWRTKADSQAVEYDDPAALDSAVARLRELPPLVTSWEIERLKELIAEA